MHDFMNEIAEPNFGFINSFNTKKIKIEKSPDYYAKASKKCREKKKQEVKELSEQNKILEVEMARLTSEINCLSAECNSLLQLSTRRRFKEQILAVENTSLHQELKRFKTMTTSLKKFLQNLNEESDRDVLKTKFHLKVLHIMDDLLSLSFESLHSQNWRFLSIEPSKLYPSKLDVRAKFFGNTRMVRIDFYSLPISFESLKNGMNRFLDVETLQQKMNIIKNKLQEQHKGEACEASKVHIGYQQGDADTQGFWLNESSFSNVVVRSFRSVDGYKFAERMVLQSICVQNICSNSLFPNGPSDENIEAILITSKDLSENEISQTFPRSAGTLKNEVLPEAVMKPTMQSFIVTKDKKNEHLCNVSMFARHDHIDKNVEPLDELACSRFAQKNAWGIATIVNIMS